MRPQVEEEGGGGVRQHPDGAGHDQARPPLQGGGGQLRGGEVESTARDTTDQDFCQGEHQCPQGKVSDQCKVLVQGVRRTCRVQVLVVRCECKVQV